jgi:hypothetical protein
MKRTLVGLFLAASLLRAQATFSQGTPATAAKPSVLVANSPDGLIKCTLTGNTFPATTIIIGCALNGVTIQPFSLPIGTFTAFTFQFNQGTNAVSVMTSWTPSASGGASAQAAVNGGAVVTGTF